MSQWLQNVLGGSKPAEQPPAAQPEDFFDDIPSAAAPQPTPASLYADQAGQTSGTSAPSGAPFGQSFLSFSSPPAENRPFTKWYRVWERVGPADLFVEMFILPFLIIIIFLHLWGVRKNKRKVNTWARTHLPVLQSEFAFVGIAPKDIDVPSAIAKLANDPNAEVPDGIVRMKSSSEFISYATGRQNAAFVDIKLILAKRYNPFARFADQMIGFLFESMPAARENMEARLYPFDGREDRLLMPLATDELQRKDKPSTYDDFIFGILHKAHMKELREARYDLSLTTTREHPKIPKNMVIMSESGEITDAVLTPELCKALELAGDDFEALIITDQPVEQPKKLNETVPKKRIDLILALPSPSATSKSNTASLFQAFLSLPDALVNVAHFRPEALKRVKQTREDEQKKIRKSDVEDKAEKRSLEREKEKKKERDEKLKNMTADEQKKFVERERRLERERGMKKRTMRA